MKINEFRFLRNDEPFVDRGFINWSRCYEWGYVLEKVKEGEYKKIHNTCCGPSAIHKQFHDSLVGVNSNVINSDIRVSDTNKNFLNFKVYDLTVPETEKYDLVLCISTLEEMPGGFETIKKTFNNLYEQLEDGGRLIITCDYPDVNVTDLENILGSKCLDTNRLDGSNSIYRQMEYKHLNVILIDVTKDD